MLSLPVVNVRVNQQKCDEMLRSYLWLLATLFVVFGQQSTFYAFGPEHPSGEKNIALTFDDGPHRILTTRLLDSLQKLKQTQNISAHVTFFVMGVKVLMHPDILHRSVKEGHEVANHAWNHPVISQIPWEDLQSQMYHTSQAIFNATGQWPKVMRPPYGKTNGRLNNRVFKELHLPVILWSLDTLDWQRPRVDAIVKKAVDKAKPGSVILCHDIHPNTVQAIPLIVQQLSSRGFIFRSVSEMIALYSPKSLPKSSAPPPAFV